MSTIQCFLLWVPLCLSVGAASPPRTVSQTKTNQFPGFAVWDPYPWLENSTSQEVQTWENEQSLYASNYLANVPVQPLIADQFRRWTQGSWQSFRQIRWAKEQGFALYQDSFFTPAKLVRFPALQFHSNVVNGLQIALDPLQWDSSGLRQIDAFFPSPDGSLVAVVLTHPDEPSSSLVFFRTVDGTRLEDQLPDVQIPGFRATVEWSSDGQSVFYARYVRRRGQTLESVAPKLFHHTLRSAAPSDLVQPVGNIPPGSTLTLQRNSSGNRFALTATQLVTEERTHWIREPSGDWHTLATPKEGVVQIAFGRDPAYIESPRDDGIYLLVRDSKASKGKIVRVPAGTRSDGLANGTTLIPEAKEFLLSFQPSSSGIYGFYSKGGLGQLLFYDRMEKDIVKSAIVLPLPAAGFVPDYSVWRGDELVYRTESFLEASEWYYYDPNHDRDRARLASLYDRMPFDFSDCVVERVTIKTNDVRIPLYLIQRNGVRQDGSNPVLLTCVGEGQQTAFPAMDWSRRVWLDQGGIIAVAQVRGGSELGSSWREAGAGTNKHVSYEDLYACARYLVQSNATRPQLLGVWGQGYGAWAASMWMLKNPGSLQAAVLEDGVYDLLRADAIPGGGRTLASEFAGVPLAERWPLLRSLSPYALLTNAGGYPPVWLFADATPGDFAQQFNPGQSRKWAARLQSFTQSQRPTLLSVQGKSGSPFAERVEQKIQRWISAYSFFFDQLGVPYSLVERGPWAGGVTPHTAVVKAKINPPNASVRLALSDNPSFSSPAFTPAELAKVDSHHLVSFPLEGLRPSTHYHYALEINGRMDWASRGQFETFPEGPASFKIAFASCAKTASANEVFDRIRENRPLLFMNTGDFHYLNINTNSIQRFREAYDLVLSSLPQGKLYRNVAFAYVWDDHDYGGNNSNRKASSHEAARKAYEEYVPHYPLAAGGGDQPIYQSFSIGRVKFILTDLRSERDDVKKEDNERKSMMGATQKAWFKQQLLEANGKYPLICWVSSVPWLGVATTNYYPFIHHDQYGFIHQTNFLDATTRTNKYRPTSDEDHWAVFSTERREIADFVKSNHIQGLCILHGDSHMLAADDGSHADFATGGGAPIPVMCAAPLDQTPSIKGGPYSQGIYKVRKDEGCFGLLEVEDRGSAIDVAFSGRNNENKERISLRFSVPATAPSRQP